MGGITSIQSQAAAQRTTFAQPTFFRTAGTAAPAALAPQIAMAKDHTAVSRFTAGKAMTSLAIAPHQTLASRWQKLDTPERFFVGLFGVIGTAAITTMAVAGARAPAQMAAKTALTGMLKGAAIGGAATLGTAVIMDVAFTGGCVSGGFRKLVRGH